jgi:predicted transcriptional regulator
MTALVDRRALPGGELEYAVLRALHERGSASVREVYDAIGEPNGLVYTTVAKVMDRLLAKRLVARKRAGRAFVYVARISSADLERGRASRMLDGLLGPEPYPAIASLVDAVEARDPHLLDELARLVNARRRSRRGA